MTHALPSRHALPGTEPALPGAVSLLDRARALIGRLALVQRIGFAVLAVQFVGFAAWSWVLWHRFALTWDFGVYHQPWWLIAHGNLDPRTSVESMPFWRNDAEFAIWPLAVLYWPLGNVGLLWAQDAGVVLAELVAFSWICELAGGWKRHGSWLAGAGLVLLAGSPWLWWSVSFDFHLECIAIPFALLLARDLWHGRRRMWWWVVPVLLCGAPEAVYVLGIGAGAALCGRKYWRSGAVLAVTGVAYSGLIVLLHADNGAPLARHYGYLAAGGAAIGQALRTRMTTGEMVRGIIGHPARVVSSLWAKRDDVAAAIMPGGIIGLAWRPLLPAVLVGLLSAILSAGWRFAQPSFQLLPVYTMLAVGTVGVLAWLGQRHARTALVLTGVLVVQAVAWAVIWYPQVTPHWLRVSSPSAAELTRVEAMIPQSAEVIASQGVLGPFTSRPDVLALTDQRRMAVHGRVVWFVIAPHAGTELQAPVSAMALAAELAGPLHAALVSHGAGVWAFRWARPPGQTSVGVPEEAAAVPGWAAAGASGRADTSGTDTAGWSATSNGRRGYIADGMTWLEPPGSYAATVDLEPSAGTNVEVWDDNGAAPQLLARRTMAASSEDQVVTMHVTAPLRSYRVFSGAGLFSARFVPAPPGQRIEIRVWSPSSGITRVYSASLKAAW